MRDYNPEVNGTEKYISEFGGIIKADGVSYAVTNDGENLVPIPESFAKIIKFALKAQDRTYNENRPDLLRYLSVINCRKAALTASGNMDFAKAVDDESDDLSAIEDLFLDTERIQVLGFKPIILPEHEARLTPFLDEYGGSFPVIVHYYDVDKHTDTNNEVIRRIQENEIIDAELLRKIHRRHSFLVLGESEDEYVCFQKTGPFPNEPLVISGIDLVESGVKKQPNRSQLVFMGPAI